ncbi:MAG: zinc ribbon domain-containing protein [Methanomassiliicoccaceae archaeon]|nr:zinc ribbon domain-containing protein [Methanomassiliicoccaceae archaeon]
MLKAFTRNYNDNSTDAGFEFTFNCDVCNDGYKSSFIESDTYKKKRGTRLLGQGANIIGNLAGGRARTVGSSAQQGSNAMSQTFEGKPPEWHKEHEQAFERAQNESKEHFHRCPGCNSYVCDHCWNEDATLCTKCAPRQEVSVAQAHAKAMQRDIDKAGDSATVWQGKIESKTTICPSCGKPAGTGKFCNNCGTSMEQKECPKCGAKNALGVRFCNNCGENLQQAAAAPDGKCPECGFDNPPGTKFCGDCGSKMG